MEITGTVVQINEDRHWYRVQYETPQGPQYECFPLPVEPEPEEPKDCRTEPYKRYCGGYHHFTGQAFRNPSLDLSMEQYRR